MRIGLSFAALSAIASFSFAAGADVQHVVGKGHTIEAIAHRYHVSAQSIIDANHLKDVKHLKVGDVLTIPKVEKKGDDKGGAAAHDKDGKHEKDTKKDGSKGKTGKDTKAEHAPVTFASKAKTPGVIHIQRLGTGDEHDLRVADG